MSGALNHSQQESLFDPSDARPVTLIGAGSVGSHVAVMLTKMGVRDLMVYDHDGVESHNIPMSVYRPSDLGRKKVLALWDRVREVSGVEIKARAEPWVGQALRTDVICCVDTMEARQALWKASRLNPHVGVFVDTRVAQEFVSVFAVSPSDPEDQKFYEYFLRYATTETVKPTCGNHGIITVSTIAAAVAVSQLTAHWKGGIKKRHFQMLIGTLVALP